MFHTLTQTDYIKRVFGPILPPPVHVQWYEATPDEHRSISEVHRLRRAHSAMIDARKQCLTVSFVMGNETIAQIDESCASLRTVLFYHLNNIDRLRVRRGLAPRRKVTVQ